jgi:hypothetical protein
MRVQDGSFRTKQDKNGASCYLHRLADGTQPDADILPRPPGPEVERADADTMHAVYSALLAKFPLLQKHRQNLRERGLPDAEIDRGSYRSLLAMNRTPRAAALWKHFGNKLLTVPGFVSRERDGRPYLTVTGPAGLLVPVRDAHGRIIALKVRRDEAATGPKYVYLSSKNDGGAGPGAPVHVPVGTPEKAELVRLTEGELKADVVRALTGLPTLSVPGAGTWRPVLPVLQAMGCKTVRLAFDADAWNNATVARSLAACADALAEAGFALELERWDAADGKGLDDLLAAGKAPELVQGDAALRAVRDILTAASVDEEPAPPNELDRLQDVLNAEGPAGLYRDKKLLQALAALSVDDPPAYARIRVSLRAADIKMRDFDRAIKRLITEQIKERPPQLARGETGGFFEDNGCICRTKLTPDGPLTVALCNLLTVR